MNKEKRDELKRLYLESTKTTEWVAHRGGDCYGPEATIRGPFFRWFKVADAIYEDAQQRIATAFADVQYGAAAMNSCPELLAQVDELEAEMRDLLNALRDNVSKVAKYEKALKCITATHYQTRGVNMLMPDAERIKIAEQALADDASENPK